MLFTNIQLDGLTGTLARFLERLEMEGEDVEEREWIMTSIVGRAGGFGGTKEGMHTNSSGVKVMVKRATTIAEDEETKMGVDDSAELKLTMAAQASPATSEADEAASAMVDECPIPFKLAAQLTFAMLSHVLKYPTRKPSPFARSTLNPYLTTILTFLTTLSKHTAAFTVLERPIPWDKLTKFFSIVPRNVMVSQGLNKTGDRERSIILTTGLTTSCAPPLAEDRCLRGMEWVGRRVFERGYWKNGEESSKEVKVLDAGEGEEATNSIIEDEDDEDRSPAFSGSSGGETRKRWTRIVRWALRRLLTALGGSKV
jgi:protein SMG6